MMTLLRQRTLRTEDSAPSATQQVDEGTLTRVQTELEHHLKFCRVAKRARTMKPSQAITYNATLRHVRVTIVAVEGQ
jgi:hypothetical protein